MNVTAIDSPPLPLLMSRTCISSSGMRAACMVTEVLKRGVISPRGSRMGTLHCPLACMSPGDLNAVPATAQGHAAAGDMVHHGVRGEGLPGRPAAQGAAAAPGRVAQSAAHHELPAGHRMRCVGASVMDMDMDLNAPFLAHARSLLPHLARAQRAWRDRSLHVLFWVHCMLA